MTSRLPTQTSTPHDREHSAGHQGQANGQTADSSAAETASPARQRAEELVDQWAERVGHYAGVLGHKLLWLAARGREEAEDIWAEAQALRRQQRPDAAGPSDSRSA